MSDMGTNYYFLSKNKELMQKSFAQKDSWGISGEEYKIVDEPYLGYKVHLNKLSCGWRPLFQSHKMFKTFKELEAFYHYNDENLEIYDEYGEKYSWKEYFEKVNNHSLRPKEAVKWVYEVDVMLRDKRPTLHTVVCNDNEAEIYIPFDHVIYSKSEQEARVRFQAIGRIPFIRENVWNDPDYLFDWTEGDFT